MRILTEFPVSFRTNRIADADLGYRLDPTLADVDANGFRNGGLKPADAEVFAVGDSHTYGNNVVAEESWPAGLGRISGRRVYNTGVGSYGIASYHAMLARMLGKGTAVAIVAIYPANDFLPRASFCEINFAGPYWAVEVKRLNLQLAEMQDDCRSDKNRGASFNAWVRGNVAVVSAVNELLLRPYHAHQTSVPLPGGLPAVDLEDQWRDREATRKERALMAESKKLFADWGGRWKGRVGIVMIPSKLRVLYEILTQRGVKVPAAVEEIAGQEIAVEDFVRTEAGLNGIAFDTPLLDLVGAMETGRVYPSYDGHPVALGYEKYAAAAARVLGKLDIR